MTMRFKLKTYMASAMVVASFSAVADAQRRDRDELADRIDTTFSFARNGTVELQAAQGDVVVTGWSRDQIRVRATSERSALRFDVSPSYVALGLRSGTSRSGDTRFEVTVPVGTQVRAQTSSGDIRISGSKGEVDARTQRGDIVVEDVGARAHITAFSGDIEVTDVTGELRINAMSGDIRVRGVGGEVEVKTVSGEIDLHDVRSRVVRVNTTSGDISFDGTIDPAGRYELQTHSGDVDLTLPSNVAAELTVSTYSGSVESDFPMVLMPNQGPRSTSHGRALTFTLGRGGARVMAESFSGDINIRNRGGRPPSRDGNEVRQ